MSSVENEKLKKALLILSLVEGEISLEECAKALNEDPAVLGKKIKIVADSSNVTFVPSLISREIGTCLYNDFNTYRNQADVEDNEAQKTKLALADGVRKYIQTVETMDNTVKLQDNNTVADLLKNSSNIYEKVLKQLLLSSCSDCRNIILKAIEDNNIEIKL